MTTNNDPNQETNSSPTEKGMVERVSAVGIMGNVLLVAFKLFAGLVGNSSALISDAVHSLSDVLATFLAYLGVTISGTPADKSHPYGHEQLETLATIAIGLILLVAGGGIGYVGVKQIVTGEYLNLPQPHVFALIAAVVSIVTKEAMFWYTLYYARKLNSSAFMADAWHHRSDALSSIGALIGVGFARLGYPIMDPIASVVISLFILKITFDILWSVGRQIVDVSCDDEFERKVADCILSIPGVDNLDLLRSRKFGTRVFIEAEISVDGAKSLYIAHRISHEAHNAVEKAFPAVKHIMIHVNPTQINDKDAEFGQKKTL